MACTALWGRRTAAGGRTVGEQTIYIVDDDTGVRVSTAFFLQAAGFSPRPYSSGRQLLADVAGLRPGCVLLDIRMPDMDGFEVIERLLPRRAQFPVVVMTGHGDVATAVRSMKLGACDFLEKPFDEDVLVATLERLFLQLEDSVLGEQRRTDAAARLELLTAREVAVLHGLLAGHSNKVLAFELAVSVRTIEMHRANMMDRLGVRTFAEALRLAFDAGCGGGSAAPPVARPSPAFA